MKTPRIIKLKDIVPDPQRSEGSLLEILIQRNPDRAEIIIKKLKRQASKDSGCQPQRIVVDS